MPAKKSKASDLFVRALENEGVKYIFGVPGEENLDLLESIRTSSIQFILTRHEQAAGFMAATYGRLTGEPGVCLSTLGPGATNLVTAAAYAKLGGMPMVMLTGQKPIKSSKQGRFQIVDVVRMLEPLTKMTRQVVGSASIPSLVRESFRLAAEECPGPVHLELPEDIAEEKTDEPVLFTVTHARRPDADQKAIARAIQMLQAAKKPLLLIGAGANRKWAHESLSEFVEKTQIPFFNTQMGKGVIDERHPCFLGTAALSSGDYLHCAIEQADLIINVGHDIVEKPPFLMEQGDKHHVIHINFLPAHVDPVYFPQLEVVGDIGTTIRRLTEGLTDIPEYDFDYFKRVKNGIDTHIVERSDDPAFPLIPQRVVADVRTAMPCNGVIALDNGIYKIWFARNYLAHEPNTVLLDNALASMGAGLPSAMMAAMLYPERQVMAICGDGGFMMNSQEMETAVRLKLNLVVLILRDDAYGMIRWKQEDYGFPDYSLDFGNPDFVAYAKSYGAKGHRIEKTEDFVPTLQHCFKAGGVHLIDTPVDYSENQRVLIDELKHKVCLI